MRSPSLRTAFGALTRRLRRLRGTLGSAGLVVALVAGQGGALLHELSHYQPAADGTASAILASAQESAATASLATGQPNPQPQPRGPDHGSKVCDLCLAFAQLAGALHSDSVAAPLIADLHDSAASFDAFVVVDTATPAPRSRGPPAFL